MRKVFLSYVLLFVIFFYSDYKTYYYGIGKGWFSEKLPEPFYIDYGTFKQGHPSFSIVQADMNLFLISENKNIRLNHGSSINIDKILGYYYNNENIIAKVKKGSNIIGIKISKSRNRSPYHCCYFTELNKGVAKGYKYVNLENHTLIGIMMLIYCISIFIILVSPIIFLICFLIRQIYMDIN